MSYYKQISDYKHYLENYWSPKMHRTNKQISQDTFSKGILFYD